MIQPDAKCVVNGKKVNEIALWVNQFIALTSEEIDVVVNNKPAKKWFLTGQIPGGISAGDSGAGDRDNLGGTSGSAKGTGGGASGNRDQLTTAPAGGAGGPVGGGDAGQGGNVNAPINIDTPQGMPKYDPTTGKAVPGTGSNLSGLGDDTRGTPMSDEEYQAWMAAGSPPPSGGLPVSYANGNGMPTDRTSGGLPASYANGNGMPTDRTSGGLPASYANGNGMPTDRTSGGLPASYANGNGMPTDRTSGFGDDVANVSTPSGDPARKGAGQQASIERQEAAEDLQRRKFDAQRKLPKLRQQLAEAERKMLWGYRPETQDYGYIETQEVKQLKANIEYLERLANS